MANLKAIKDLVDFCLKANDDTGYWKGEVFRLAKRAKEVLPGLEKELAGDTEDLVRRSYEEMGKDNYMDEEARSITKCCGDYMDPGPNNTKVCRTCKQPQGN